MSKISEHVRRTKNGKTIKIRPHDRERNKIVDPGEKHIDLQDEKIIKAKLIDHLNYQDDRTNKLIDGFILSLLRKEFGFIDIENIHRDVLKKPIIEVDFYIYYIMKGNSIKDTLEAANVLRALQLTDISGKDCATIISNYEKLSILEFDSLMQKPDNIKIDYLLS